MQKAKEARERAYAPYSNFPVGAALLAKSGKIYSGANFENAAFGAGLCAERAALAAAISAGEREFLELAVVADIEGGPTPCGICRQAFFEFGDLTIHAVPLKGTPRTFKLSQLLPSAFADFKGAD